MSSVLMDLAGGNIQNSRRRIIYSSVCAICHEMGFGSAEKVAIETLVQMLQSLLYEVGRTSRAFCEVAGRTEPLVGDVIVALVELGVYPDNLSQFAGRPNKLTIPTPGQVPKHSMPKILQTGEKRPLSSYIPDYFPPFPDQHAYIRTPTHKQPVTEYEAIREKSASQKRDVERALTRFMAKTCEHSVTHSLFQDQQMSLLFPLIAIKVENSYLQALLPKDQVFDDVEDDHQKKEFQKKSKTSDETSNQEQTSTISNDNEKISEFKPVVTADDLFDNPYLRPVKLCRKKTRKFL